MTDPQHNQVRPRRRAGRTMAVAAAVALAAGTLLAAVVGFAGPAGAAGPSITVSPSSGLSNGQNVTVKGSGFTPNYSNMVVVECAASATGANGCNTNDVKFTKADATGGFTVTLTLRSKFGSTDCTKVECIVQGHEGFSTTSGKTGTSAALRFGAAAKPAPTPTHKKTTAAPPPATTSSAAAGAPGGTKTSAGIGGVHAAAPGAALPTGADTGLAVSTAVPLVSEVGAAAALALLGVGLLLYRRRPGTHGH